MLSKKLENYNVILGSSSPRRHKFFKDLDIPFEVIIKPIDEVYPSHLKNEEITDYISSEKAKPYLNNLKPNDLLITSDTLVWHNDKALGKPKDKQEAFNVLKSLSNSMHEVVTSVTLTSLNQSKTVNCSTSVTFKELTDEEINYYIDNYKPYDKAGSYGIQEWIGLIGITKIEGSYFNVVGLPTHLIYQLFNTI